MLYSKNFDFSFSGLKTAVLYLIKKIGSLDEEKKKAIALEFENAAIECLTYKTAKAIEKYKIKTLIVAGGVAANTHLRREMQKITTPNPSSKRKGGDKKIKLLFPTMELARDNSVMIGIAGYLNYVKNKKVAPKPDTIKATGRLKL
jgi:N6-L-threonylcarbamoyladenine synthase